MSDMEIDAAGVATVVPAEPSVASNPHPSPAPVYLSGNALQGSSRDHQMQVKVHYRKFEQDNWSYVGRGYVTQEVHGQSSRVVVRSATTNKIWIAFGENSDIMAERRSNFVVIGVVKGLRVESWSLNAVTAGETLKLLASIELAAYKCKEAMADPRSHAKARRKVERIIKDDRRRRHKRRKDQESMFNAFANQHLSDTPNDESAPP